MNDILLVQRDDSRVGIQIVARTTAAARRLLLDANYTLCGFDDCDAVSAIGSPAASGEAGTGAGKHRRNRRSRRPSGRDRRFRRYQAGKSSIRN